MKIYMDGDGGGQGEGRDQRRVRYRKGGEEGGRRD